MGKNKFTYIGAKRERRGWEWNPRNPNAQLCNLCMVVYMKYESTVLYECCCALSVSFIHTIFTHLGKLKRPEIAILMGNESNKLISGQS
jgi:hypothetical protein